MVDNIDNKHTYIPSRLTQKLSCWCGFDKSSEEKCFYCLHQYRKEIEERVQAGILLVDKKLVK